MRNYFSIIVLFSAFLFSQTIPDQEKLIREASENLSLVNSMPEEAFQKAKEIINKAKIIDARKAELLAIKTQCDYYKMNHDFKNLLKSGELLFQTARSYKEPIYQAVAKNDLFEAYYFSGLPDRAFEQLKEGVKIVEKVKAEDTFAITVKANLYLAYVNYFAQVNDLENQLKYIKLAGEEYNREKDETRKQKFLNTYYIAFANYYLNIEENDSAYYYAEKALENEKKFNRTNSLFFNYLLLGELKMEKEEYQYALGYFEEAEKLEGYKNHYNVDELYNNIIKVYKNLNDEEGVKAYEYKRDSLKLTITENQKKSLYNLLLEKNDKFPKKLFLSIAIGVFVIMSYIVFRVMRKNRILAQQEKISKKYLDEFSKKPKGEDYSKLLTVIKENDPAFMFHFNEVFPDFSSKLLEINSKLSESDIEFCAFLKLKLPTKDIAKYKFIAPKTVLNKKYLIRDKLRIPKSTDIYYWFEDF